MSRRERALEAIARFALGRPWIVAAGAAVLVVLGVVAMLRADVELEVHEIVRTPSAKAFAKAAEVFSLDETAFLAVEADRAGREEDLLRFARALEEKLGGGVEYGLPLDEDALFRSLVLPHWARYFGPADRPRLERLLTPEGIRAQVEKTASLLGMIGIGQADDFAARDPLELARPLVARLRSLQGGYRFAAGSPYYLSEDRRALLVQIAAGTGVDAKRTVERAEAALRDLRAEPWAAGLRVHASGAAFFGVETERVIRSDLMQTMSGSIVLSILLMAFAYRVRPWWVLLLFFPTLWGAAVGIGLFAAIQVSFAGLAVACAAVLVGLGDDFMIHVTTASLAARAAGQSPGDAVLHGVRETREAVLGAALTGIAAFLTFFASEQAFLRDMGLLTAIGLVGCLAGALVVLPPILARLLRREGDRALRLAPRQLGAGWISEAAIRRPALFLGLSGLAAAAAVASLHAWPPALEGDLRNVFTRGSPALAAQARISDLFGGSREPITILVEGERETDVVEAAHRLEAPLRRLIADGTLVARASVAALVPPEEDQRAALAVLATKRHGEVLDWFRSALDEQGFDLGAFSKDYVKSLERAVLEARTGRVIGLEALRARERLRPVIDRLVRARDGRAYGLVLVHPREDLWGADRRAAVVGKLRGALDEAKVAGTLTGLYIVSDESAEQVASDFRRVSLLTIGAVVALVLLRFRRPSLALLALIPVGLGALWTAGLFGALGYKLNLMNLGILPMIVGIGVDDGIHLMHRRVHEPCESLRHLFGATGGAVALSSLTTMIAFGNLALSRNLGISSVGVLTLIGIGGSLLASVATLPAALALGERWRSASASPSSPPPS